MDFTAQRRQNLLRSLADEALDALLISNPVNVTYLTGFSGDSSHLVLTADRALVISDGRFTAQLAEECPGLATHIRPPTQTIAQASAEVLGKLGVRSVGFESDHLTVAAFNTLLELTKTLDWKPRPDRVERLRVVKDASEIEQIREAIAIAERAFSAFCALLEPDDTETELCHALEHYVRLCGGSKTSFPPIVAVGDRSALPHAPPTDRRIRDADFVLVDWGACGRFYKSDLTRVLRTRNHSTSARDQLATVHEVVCRAQRQAIEAIRPGATGHTVDATARAVIAAAGYGDYFTHGLGHGFGLLIHEGPAVRPNSEVVLQTGMVVTVEPGIYLPGWGGVRIEDDVLVTPDGCEVLTHLARDLTWQGVG